MKRTRKRSIRGYRTYIVVGLIILLAAGKYVWHYEIPEAVFEILGALGLGFIRAAVSAVPTTKGDTP
jgi:uncharacterized membrane protein